MNASARDPFSGFTSPWREVFFPALALFALCALTWLMLVPALPGFFVLDDEPNLQILADFNRNPTWTAAYQVIISGDAGPVGRPLAMASFLLNASDWPESAESFRQVNLLLHLCNGLLLFLVLRRLIGLGGGRAVAAALAITALWLASPANTATTLYVVQRMALLSAFFMLLGFYLYLVGRPMLADTTRRITGAALVLLALAIGVGLGTLSKENAITLLLVFLACEATVFATLAFRPGRRLLLAVLATPVIAAVLYMMSNATGIYAGYEIREFDLHQRLLTQPLVLATYTINTLLPVSSNISVFRDDFPIVTHLFATPAAVFALLGLLSAGVAAVVLRKKHPLAAFAVLGFFAVHALEASVVPLELYFEHRNYLGSAFILGLAAFLVARLFASYGIRLLLAVFFAYFALTGFVTYSISLTWGDPLMAAITWPSHRPDSVRAQQFAIDFWGSQGQPVQAEKIARASFQRNPKHLVLPLQAAQMRCARGEDVADDIAEARRVAKDPIVDNSTITTINRLYEHLVGARCSGMTARDILELIDLVHANARIGMRSNPRAQSWFIKANILHQLGKLADAIAALEQSHRYSGNPALRLWQTRWFLEAGDISTARTHFERYKAEQDRASVTGRIDLSAPRRDYETLAQVFQALDQVEKQHQ